MAASPTHRFGQIIGDVVESALHAPLAQIAKRHGLYLDRKQPRAARGGQSKVGWKDNKGNRHDLDYVLEAGGSDERIGLPRAFIEIAYRRYTKHSKNKAQEIQSAIAPLFERYRLNHPFIGVVLAGEFTEPSLDQLRSHGFGLLHMPFKSIVKAFKVVGIDANFDEDSEDADVQKKVEAWDALSKRERARVGEALRQIHAAEFAKFESELAGCLNRKIDSVFVLALHGQSQVLANVDSAIRFIERFDEAKAGGKFVRYELNVRYSNKDDIRGTFASKIEAIRFLRSLP